MYWWQKLFWCSNKKQGRSIQKNIEMSENNDYTTGNLLDYEYFSNHDKLIGIHLSKQIELENPDLKQQIYFIGKLEDGATMFFIIEKSEKKRLLNFHKIL